MIIINIREASVAELAHAWIADFSDLQTNMLVAIIGGATESILQRYTAEEIVATWECLRKDIKSCRSINMVKKNGHNNENQLIIANPLKMPCLWKNHYDVGGRPKEFNERHIILKDLVHASNVINAKTRLALDKIWLDKSIPLTCKPIIHQIDQFPKMSKVGYVNYFANDEKGTWNNGFEECQRAEQRTHDIQGRVDKIRDMDQFFAHTIIQGIVTNPSSERLAKSYKPSNKTMCSKITMLPGRTRYNLDPTEQQFPNDCNSRTCTNHFMPRIVKAYAESNSIDELIEHSRKEHFAKPNTTYWNLSVKEIVQDDNFAHIRDIHERISANDETLTEEEKQTPNQKKAIIKERDADTVIQFISEKLVAQENENVNVNDPRTDPSAGYILGNLGRDTETEILL